MASPRSDAVALATCWLVNEEVAWTRLVHESLDESPIDVLRGFSQLTAGLACSLSDAVGRDPLEVLSRVALSPQSDWEKDWSLLGD